VADEKANGAAAAAVPIELDLSSGLWAILSDGTNKYLGRIRPAAAFDDEKPPKLEEEPEGEDDDDDEPGGGPVRVFPAYTMVTSLTQQGPAIFVFPLEFMQTPLELVIEPTSIVFLRDLVAHDVERIVGMIKLAESNRTSIRAAQAGLVAPLRR
jgi:hypothetical protein